MTQQLTLLNSLDDWKPHLRHPIVITDHIVEELYGAHLARRLSCRLISIPPGETSKSIDNYLNLSREMIRLRCARSSTIIALGGGVVGDLAGFVAATFMRGIPCIQVPTTLLGMVDSSIGGKVGINLAMGKNLLGAFHQPQEVVAALDCLETLPDKQLRSGLSEVVKYGVILDADFFAWLETHMDKLLNKDRDALKLAIHRSAELKMKVVRKDAKENNLRQILNYGHTLGHALEKATGYMEYTHGEAIALGMSFEGQIASSLYHFPPALLERQNKLLNKIHPALSIPKIEIEELIKTMQTDKKVVENEIVFSLPEYLGKMVKKKNGYGVAVPQQVIHDALHSYYSCYSC